MTYRISLLTLALSALSAILSGCGQSVSAPVAEILPIQASSSTVPSSEPELSSSDLDPNAPQTRWFSGKVTSYSCRAPWWNQVQVNAQLQANPIYLRILAKNSNVFVGGARQLNLTFNFIGGPQGQLFFEGKQLENKLEVSGNLTALDKNKLPQASGSAVVLDYGAVLKGSELSGTLRVKVACGTFNADGSQTNYPGVITFYTNQV